MPRVDPSSRVADGAKLADDVEVGPFCTVGPRVELKAGVRLLSHVSLTGVTTIGERTVIYPFASLGTPPQSTAYRGGATRLTVGADCQIREGVTISTGLEDHGAVTTVGDRCFMMANSHVGHDCHVGDDVIFAQNAGDFIFAGSGNDWVFGQQGGDSIYGGDGNDVLNGAGADDHFFFDTALNASTNVDVIQDMNGAGDDTIHLDDAIFIGLVNGVGGVLSSAQLSTTGAATAATAQVIYNASTGALYFDQDGTGSTFSAIQFAILGDATHPTAASITTSDFIIY